MQQPTTAIMKSNVQTKTQTVGQTKMKEQTVGQTKTKTKEIIENPDTTLFIKSLLEKRITLPIQDLDANIKENIIRIIRKRFTGKCIEEGFVLPSSIDLKTYSCGKLGPGGTIVVVQFTCMVCNPGPGIVIPCMVTDITKAGVHAMYILPDDNNIKPISVYILRDHEFKSDKFDKVKKGDMIQARILGSRFELDDPCINAVAEFA